MMLQTKIPKANFHTHTTFCDGRDTAEAMVQAAIAKGFHTLGFSGHSYTHFDERYCMTKDGVLDYIKEVNRLKEVYKDQITIYLGIEQDSFSKESTAPFQYTIGSVHYAIHEGQYILVDEERAICQKDIKEVFHGDGVAYAKCYYDAVGQVLERTKGDIIGHFDLVTKFNEGNVLFDATEKAYLHHAFTAVDRLLPFDKPFEINTGAIYRGMRTQPYPSLEILKEIHRRKGSILFSSDSHDGASIGFRFEEVAKMVKEIGFKSTRIWTPTGFEELGL